MNEVNSLVSLLDYTLVLDDCTALCYSGCVSDGAKDGVLGMLALRVSLVSNGGIMVHYYEGIKIGSADGELICSTLVIDDFCTLGIY